jgi:hypothetical protein
MGCELVIRIIDILEIDDHSLENYNFNLSSFMRALIFIIWQAPLL